MPTENRSSNTELISQAASAIEDLLANGTGAIAAGAWASLPAELRAVAAVPAPQPHPEPIAWMVGTAFWWTKEEAERDAAATGLPIVGLGSMTDTAEVERLESRIKTQRESIRSHVQEVDRLRVLEIRCGLKIEERNDLLRKCLEWITSARDGVLYPIARDFEGVVGRNAEGLGQETPVLIDAIDHALSASAEPSAPNDCAICSDVGNQCMECEEGEFREWADRHFAAADYRKTDAGVFIQDWMRHAYGAWCARGALTSKQ